MPVQIIFEDVEIVRKVAESNVEMLITMHTGLAEIAKCETSPGGSAAMKYIAEQSLLRVQQIADKMEVRVNA